MEDQIDTGDTIYHKPSGETWLVAYATEREVCCCGWPCSYAKIADCELKEKASEQERQDMLEKLAAITAQSDPRRRHARHVLSRDYTPTKGPQ